MTNISQSLPVVCGAGELAVLGGLVGAAAIVGMDEPFPGLDATQIQSAIAESTRSLIERGFIQEEADDMLTLDSTIHAMLEVLTRPSRSYFCGLATPHARLERHLLHVRDGIGVELTPGATGTLSWRSRYMLLALDAGIGLSERIWNIWRLKKQAAAPGEPMQLTEAILRSATASAGLSALAAQEHLTKAGMPTRAAAVLAESLASPLKNGMLVAFALDGSGRRTSGLGFLEGTNGMWRLRAHSDPGAMRIEVVPCSALELNHELRWFLSETR